MILSVELLRQYVPGLLASPEELARRLTLSGTAVERILVGPDGAAQLETEITSNRPDLLCYLGVARELSALYGLALRLPPAAERGAVPAARELPGLAGISIEAPELCRRYTARVLRGLRVGPSPDWLRRALEHSGLRSISNVVDVTNFVLLEMNQPLHAFDLARLEGRRIRVRRAAPGETLTTIDGIERKLDPADLVIADDVRPVALAGVMGGATSEIDEATHEVLLESAWFDPVVVRRTARRHGLRTEASLRFERGADISATAAAAERAASLLAELAGAEVEERAIDILPAPLEPVEVRLRLARLARILGIEVPRGEVRRLLEAIGLGIVGEDEQRLVARIPPARHDLRREIDLIEEVGRLHGYDKLPSLLPQTRRRPEGRSRAQSRERVLRVVLEGAGWSEAITLSMSDAERERRMAPGREPVRIANPLSDRIGALRTTVSAGLLESVAGNLRRGEEDVALYELASVFRQASPPVETRACALVAGQRQRAGGELELLRRGLGTLELLCHTLRVGPLSYARAAGRHAPMALHAGQHPIGWLRLLPPELLREHDLERGFDVLAAELELDPLTGAAPPVIRYRAFTRFPCSPRDISFYAREATAADVHALLGRIAATQPLLLSHRFVGLEHRDARGIAMTLRLTYGALDRTLGAEEVERAHDALRAAFRADGRFTLREGEAPAA